MEKDISSITTDVLASIIAFASHDVADVISWRITSRSFDIACMQVLQSKLEAICSDGPGFDRIDPQAVRPIHVGSSKSLKAALRMCPLLRVVQWRPQAKDDLVNALSNSVSALLARCLHLTHLSLAFCILPNGAPSVLGSSTSLQVLSLQQSRMDYKTTDPPYREVVWQGFPQLHCLDVSYFPVTSTNLQQIAPQLLSLSIHGCDQIKGDWVWKNLDRCKCLDICGTGLNDKDISALRKAAPCLRHLFLSDRHANLWPDPIWTDRAMLRFQRKRTEVAIRMSTSPAPPSIYERLGTQSTKVKHSGPLDAMSTLEL